MNVRRAQARDAQAIERLYQTLVPGDPNVRVVPERLAELERDMNNYLLVLEREGVASGTVLLTLCLEAMYGFMAYGVVENLVVSAEARGTGGGRALLAEAERIARERHCTKLMLLSNVARREAHVFFAHMGYDGERKRGFVKYLNRAPPLAPRG